MNEPGGFGAMLQQVQAFKEKLEQMQERLRAETVEAESGGGMVQVVANGRREVVSIKIDKAIVDPDDIAMLEDLVATAVNAASRKAEEHVKKRLEETMGSMAGFLLPGLFGS